MTLNPVPIRRYEAGYIPQWEYRTEDCYMWREEGNHPAMRDVPGGPWMLRVTLFGVDRFSGHKTLKEARIEASLLLGVQP